MQILVVEDDPIFRDIVRDIVNSNFTSIAVLEAHNGTEALARLRHHSPDLVFMDIQLPKTNGLELAKQLKVIDPDVHITILTNHDNPEYREAARECGANHFISKASSIQKEVIEVVRSTLKLKPL
jgi:DNA-binding NarL/FixJ family response regulator